MIIDSNEYARTGSDVNCDVCIVGAGAAGIYLATRLAANGKSVALLEAGKRICQDGATVGIEALLPETKYCGSTDGRFFGLGGSTSRWGGLLISHSDLDLRPVPDGQFDTWAHIVRLVESHQGTVATALKVDADRAHEGTSRRFLHRVHDDLDVNGVKSLAGEFLPFRRKNLSFLLNGSDLRGELKVFLNAVAGSWTREQESDIASVEIRCDGGSFTVKARRFVLTAGTIECSRILLEMQRALGDDLFAASESIGRNLSDHLSCAIADVPAEDNRLCIKQFAPRFLRGRMRNFRFYDSKPSADAPRSFGHFIFKSDNAGFRLAKKLFGSLQARRLEKISPMEFIRGAVGLSALGFNRYVTQRLHVQSDTLIQMQLDVEQAPDPANRISLVDETDKFGRPKARIDWSIRDRDLENIDRLAKRFLDLWPADRMRLPKLLRSKPDAETTKPHDAYHPVGTCRLGTDAAAVVSPELKVRGTNNLYVLSTAVFPTAGTANPTFSMLCLGHELAGHLTESLKN
ncbi:MAG: GMC oxidoreductase [Limisphaerales bacterium]